jgi:hypothetical protein
LSAEELEAAGEGEDPPTRIANALHDAVARLSEMIVNTSFNVRGEPIVCTPEDAFRCFMGTGIEALAIGNCFLRKEDQDPAFRVDYRSAFNPD